MNPNETELIDKKNLFITALLVTFVLYGMNVLFPSPMQPSPIAEAEQEVQAEQQPSFAEPVVSVMEELQQQANVPQQHITLHNEALLGRFGVQNGRFDNASLLKYKETIDQNSPFVQLLSDSFYTQSRWEGVEAPMPSLFAANENTPLTAGNEVVLFGQNDSLRWIRRLSLDENYMLSIKDEVTNLTGLPLHISFKGEVTRYLPELPASSNVHEGFIAVLKDKLLEEKYHSISKKAVEHTTKGGWFGITDKYWQTAMVLDKEQPGVIHFSMPEQDLYQASFVADAVTLNPGQTHTQTGRIFAGAKDIDILTDYQTRYDIPKFDLTIDFGWFYFLTKPFLYILNWLYGILGNMGITIIVFATLIRGLMLPIATKSYANMAKMRKLQPQLQSLQKRYKDDRARLQIEMMSLYKREQVNPASGCLPLFFQIPVFYALYKVLSVSIGMRQAPFYGWIHDLSMPDPSSVFTAFGYIDWPIPAILNIGVLPILMGLTMIVQQRLSPAPTDPTQAKVLKWMPVIFTFMLGGFAAGLVLYWAWSNILSILQQKYIMHKVGAK